MGRVGCGATGSDDSKIVKRAEAQKEGEGRVARAKTTAYRFFFTGPAPNWAGRRATFP